MEKSERVKELVQKNDRKTLNKIATDLKISDPERFLNKTQVAEAIVSAQERIYQETPKEDKGTLGALLRDGKQIKDATLEGKKTEEHAWFDKELKDDGDENAPPLELDEELKEQILDKLEDKINEALNDKAKTKTYSNGENEWKVILRAKNDYISYEHKVLAMQVGTRGVLVAVIESSGTKSSMSLEFILNGRIEFKDGKNFLK